MLLSPLTTIATIVLSFFVVAVNVINASSSSTTMMTTTTTTRRRRRKRNGLNSNTPSNTNNIERMLEDISPDLIYSMSMSSTTIEANQSDIISSTSIIDDVNSDSTTTNINNEQEQEQSPDTTLIYNKRIAPCPGFEELGIHGYINLQDLQLDLIDYYTLAATSTANNNNIPSVSPTSSVDGPSIENESGSSSSPPSATLEEESSSDGPTIDILEPVTLPDYSSSSSSSSSDVNNAADDDDGNSTVLTTATDGNDTSASLSTANTTIDTDDDNSTATTANDDNNSTIDNDNNENEEEEGVVVHDNGMVTITHPNDDKDHNNNANTTTTTMGEEEDVPQLSSSEGLPYVDNNGTVVDEGVEGGVLYPPNDKNNSTVTTTVDSVAVEGSNSNSDEMMGPEGWLDDDPNKKEGLINKNAPGYETVQTTNDNDGGDVSIMGGGVSNNNNNNEEGEMNTLDVYANDRHRRHRQLGMLRHGNNDKKLRRNLQGGMEGDTTDSELIIEENGLMDEVESQEEQGTSSSSSSSGSEVGSGGQVNANATDGMEGVEDDEGVSTSMTGSSTTAIPIPEAEEGEAASIVATTEDSESSSTTTSSETTTLPTVSFPICPMSTLTYPPPTTAVGVTIEPEPIVLHTPSMYNPISIYCITALIVNNGNDEEGGEAQQGVDTRSCSMIGGNVHLLFQHTTTTTAAAETTMAQDQGSEELYYIHPITISGITFKQSKSSSIQMFNPQSDVTFVNCGWEDNGGGGGIDDDQSSSEATIFIDGRHDHGNDNSSSSWVSLSSEEEEEEEAPVSSSTEEEDDTTDMERRRRRREERGLQNEGDVAAPRQQSTITIKDSSFRGNTGSATIQVIDNGNSNKEEGELSSISSPSSSLLIEDTTFTSSNVDTSIILNDGGHVQVTDVTFMNNTAQSIISSDNNGIVSMADTQFEDNDIQGNDGVVVLDTALALEMNSGNCGNSNNNKDTSGTWAEFTTTTLPEISSKEEESNNNNSAGEVMQGDGGIIISTTTTSEEEASGTSTRFLQQEEQSEHCNGISSNGVCNAFVSCDDSAVVTLTGPEFGQGPPPCFSDWDILVTAVKDRPNGIREFIICPGAVLSVTSSPVVIDSNYITIQCGTADEPARNCTINGGYSHFDIVGSSSGVELARLRMSHSTGSSIRAFGTSDATLNLRDCEWMYNKGASAILIHDNEAFNVNPTLPPSDGNNGSETKTLDIKDLLSQPTLVGSAMSVEVANCTFGENELNFGAISNVGGTLKVYKSHFLLNSGEGGDIVVTNAGSSNVQSSCFSNSSSVAPGIIFIEDGSKMSGSGNFGAASNTAGSYKSNGADQSCTHVFQEAGGSNCLGGVSDTTTGSCTGSCLAFTTTSCPLDEVSSVNVGVPTAAPPKDEILVPAVARKEEGGSSKIIPIVVAAVVCAFIVFGFIGIIMRRRKVSSSEGASRSGGGGGGKRRCCKRGLCCKRGGNEDIELQEQNEFD